MEKKSRQVPCATCGVAITLEKHANSKYRYYCEKCRPLTAYEIGDALRLSNRQAQRLLRLAGIEPIDSYAGKYGPVHLYGPQAVDRLRRASSEEIEKARGRQSSAQKAIQTKTAQLMALIAKLVIENFPDDVWTEARNCYAFVHGFGNECGPSGLIAYIRHNYSNYESLLADAEGRVGSTDFHQELQYEVNMKVERLLLERGLLDSTTDVPLRLWRQAEMAKIVR